MPARGPWTVDDVEDLDASALDDEHYTAPPTTSAPRRGSTGRIRSPWLLPLATTMLVLLIAAVGARHARALATEDLDVARQLAHVQLGPISVAQAGSADGNGDDVNASGDVAVATQVLAYNSGDQPLRATATAISLADASLQGAKVVTLYPGKSAIMQLDLVVDCQSPAGAASLDAVEPPVRRDGQWLELDVTADGITARQRYLIGNYVGSDLPTQLGRLCPSTKFS